MQTLNDIKAMLAQRGLVPRKRFGQNFLHDHNQLRKLVDAATIAAGDVVLEIGPGTGALTEFLLERHAEVIGCEIDRDLCSLLRDRFGERMTVIEGDCLDRGRALSRQVRDALNGRPFKLVANLPYNVASPVIVELLLHHAPQTEGKPLNKSAQSGAAGSCIGMFITIQREVADRLLAMPGTKDYGPLSVIVQTFARVDRISVLNPSCFWPAPKVTSSMVTSRMRTDVDVDDRSDFAAFVTQTFGGRRKQLGRLFGRDRPLSWWPDGATPDQRCESLTPSQWIELWRQLRHEQSRR